MSSCHLSKHTTYQIGGPAQHFQRCNSEKDLQTAISRMSRQQLPWFVLGNGSNIIVSDSGFPGMVIKLGGDFKKVVFEKDALHAGGGVLLPSLSRHCMARGWGGFEFMCGIPGTIGGAVIINAGTSQGQIKDNFLSIKVLSPEGTIRTFNHEEMRFSHRHSALLNTKDIILSATFSKPYQTEKNVIKKRIKDIIASRRQKQPKNKRNCGSVFKSPPGGEPAGWYIEQAGLKGLRRGGAMIAYEHANWIVNLGGARAEEVKTLIEIVQKAVWEKFGIMLEREVIYVPEDL